MHRMICLLAALWLLVPLGATAQQLPAPTGLLVDDRADLLPPADEAALSAQLQQLRDDTGLVMLVLTLDSYKAFGWDRIEPFATALFNDWGIGDAQRNNGILVLVARADREMRIELGAGYTRGYNRVAQSLVDVDFLPAFREDDYARGIMQGTGATITEIARPYMKGTPAPEPPKSAIIATLIGAIIQGLFIVTVIGLVFRRAIARRLTRLRRCPTCGQRALHLTRETTIPATRQSKGAGEKIIRCDACDYRHVTGYSIARRGASTGSGGSYGGGSSSGGGASGRW